MVRSPNWVWPLVALAFALAGGPAHAQRRRSAAPFQSPAARVTPPPRPAPPPRGDTVPLPFGLVWGDSQSRLASLFAGVGAKITEKKPAPHGETWTVQGLIAPGLQASIFTFGQGILVGVEFDYGAPEWDTAKFNDIMGQLRRRLEALAGGPGEMISRGNNEPPADPSIKQSLMGYQWNRGDTMLQLFYFSAEEPGKALTYRTISVHYHFQDPLAAQTPETPPGDGSVPGGLPINPPAGEPSVNVPSEGKPAPRPDGGDALPER